MRIDDNAGLGAGSQPAPVQSGDILAGKYCVERVLGVGGMGVVVAAHHIHLDEKVAIKFLLPSMLDNADAVARFAREARAAVKIKSEHVARVTDVGKLENGSPYMVMEYLEGGDLAGWLEKKGHLPIEQAVEFLLQAAEALAEAHGMGIIHRDLKPSNLFVTRKADGSLSVKVLDFGISKMSQFGDSGGDMAMTKTTSILGSPFYMSPEQLESAKNVDSRTDVWALGVILHELLTGGPPFVADSLPELVLKIVGHEPAPLSTKRPDLPATLQEIVGRCLTKDRTKRYQTVAELAQALRPFATKRARESIDRISRVLENASRSSRGLAPHEYDTDNEPVPASAVGPRTMASWGTTQSKSGTDSRVLIAVATLLGLSVMAIGGYVVFVRSPGGAPSAEPTQVAPPSGGAAATAAVPPENPPAHDVAEGVKPSGPVVTVAASAEPPSANSSTATATAQPKRVVRPKTPPAAGTPKATATPQPPAPAAAKPSVFDDRK